MKNDKMIFLCEKILEQARGDFRAALDAIDASADSCFALGDRKHAEQFAALARFFVQYFGL